MKTLISTLIVLLCTATVRAEDSASKRDYDALKNQKEQAAAKALAPVFEIYKKRLAEIYAKALQEKDLTLAVAIKAELDEFAKNDAPKNDPDVTKRAFERRLFNTKWAYPHPDKPKAMQFIEFKPNGLLFVGWAAGQGMFKWNVEDNLKVTIRPFIDQNSFQTMQFEPDLKSATYMDSHGNTPTTLFK